MKGPLPVRVELLEQVLLVEDGLVTLDGSADLLVEDADDFFGCLLLEVRKRTARSRDALRERLRVGDRCRGDRSWGRVRLESQENIRSKDLDGSVGVYRPFSQVL